MQTTLCIVDMQPVFRASVKVIEPVIHQVKLAKRRKDAIVVVEYGDYTKTHASIMEAVIKSGCPYDVVLKFSIDGGTEILQAVEKHGYSSKRFRVCGVNRTACVQATALGLIRESQSSLVEVEWFATSDGFCGEDEDNSNSQRYYRDLCMKYERLRIRR